MSKYHISKEFFTGLPPAYIETAEFDCLHDDGILYSEKLRLAGIEVTLNETKGTMHGFDIMQKAPTTKSVIAARIRFMKNLDDLSASAMKRFFLGILGKREERIEEEQRLLREANSALLSAEYELTSMKEQVEDIQAHFFALESSVQEYVNALEVIGDVQMKKNLLLIIRMPDICYQIRDRIRKIRPLLAKAENVYSYGGLQTNHAIRSHNNRDAAMREHGKRIQDVLDELIALLTTYNQIAPEKFYLDFYKDWMDSADFWESYPIAEASLDRIKKVEKWFYRMEGAWQNMQNELNEEMNIIREAVLEYLI